MYRLFLILLPFFSFSQTTIQDDFSDGDFSVNPIWYGDTSRFLVSNQQLSLADSIANNSALATLSPVSLNATWEIEFSLDFNPSGSNYARFYLMYNRSQADGQGQGYFLEIGGSSSDQISLYKADRNQESLLAASPVDQLDKNLNHLALRVSRDAQHNWVLAMDTLLNGSFFTLDSAQDSSYVQSQIMAWQCHYTRTRSDKFFLHRVMAQGEVYRDTIAAQADSLAIENQDLIIYFNEALDFSQSLYLQDFYLDSLYRPSAYFIDSLSPYILRLSFTQPFPINKTMKLDFQNVLDQAGNSAQGEVEVLNYNAQVGHLIINEIMVDPSPVVGLPPQALPESEYLELYNTSPFTINLKAWQLQINEDFFSFPYYQMPPESYLILVSGSRLEEFENRGSCLDIGFSTYSLLNDGAALSVISPDSLLIDAVEYNSEWYQDPLKSEGGWSLARSESNRLCRGPSRWQASAAIIGGSPGQKNSFFPTEVDSLAPQIDFIAWQEEGSVVLHFDESVELHAPILGEDISIVPHLAIDSLSWSLNQDYLKIHLAEAPQYGQAYSISIKDSLGDCQGNKSLFTKLLFALPVDAQEGDISISEILFAPKTGGADFIEIYNNSNKVFDLAHLRLAHWDEVLGPDNFEILSNESQLFFPGEYLALSEDILFLKEHYYCDNANLREADLPTFPSDKGTFALLNSRLEIIERGAYAEDWHFQLLEDYSGVSLERVDFTHLPTSKKFWQSATQREKFATPGRANSQGTIKLQRAEWEAIPPYFSPNGDGNLDQAQLNFSCEGGASILTVDIYSSRGERVRSLAEYDFREAQGYFLWDGFNSEGQLLAAGIYIAVLEYYNDQGISSLLRTPVVLSR